MKEIDPSFFSKLSEYSHAITVAAMVTCFICAGHGVLTIKKEADMENQRAVAECQNPGVSHSYLRGKHLSCEDIEEFVSLIKKPEEPSVGENTNKMGSLSNDYAMRRAMGFKF